MEGKIYRRTLRQHKNGTWDLQQIKNHPKFCIRSNYLGQGVASLIRDFNTVLNYIEPCDENSKVFSAQTHTLLLRACIEFEAHAKSILIENKYPRKPSSMTKKDYRKIEQSHFTSKFRVSFNHWSPRPLVIYPFKEFAEDKTPDWYDAYNKSKHDRHDSFKEANLLRVVYAVSAILA